ncbi:chloride channel protein [Rudaeicoccus suwonensis]|uniref:H+/Cl-antiporter ClcA n=1 Tax=Rudaeicoccus suwonensis TaxID=657409 RepID=A0A561E797_9MICO|nr:chloride channel protein [Rudaeicoccus suwonensis]TWE11430.1 H+/Cl- antiporter ClcA [Rudaeicoccus suwonensis]
MIAAEAESAMLRGWTRRTLSGVRSAPYLRKWLILGAIIGVVAGLGAILFYYGLTWGTHFLLTDIGGFKPASTSGEGGYHDHSGFSRPWAIPLLVGAGGLVSGLIVFTWAPEAEGHGTDSAIKAVHSGPKSVRPRVIIVKLVASIVTIASGGSGGREGPTAQISAGFGSVMARVLNLTPKDARICVAAGIASGIGAIFKAPLGGAFLGVELLYTEDVEIDALIPSVVATAVGYGIFCSATGGFTPVFGNNLHVNTGHPWQLVLFALVGIVAGLFGKLYTWSFYGLTDFWNRMKMPRAVKPAIAGVLVGFIGLAVPGALGTGYGALQGQIITTVFLTMPLWLVIALPFAKILATGMTIGSGGSGGIFGPGMVIGGASGALLWRAIHPFGVGANLQTSFVIVGMAACFGAIAHAQISVILMVAEMTGSIAVLPPSMVAIAFSCLVVGSMTIYRSQLMRRSDSPAHRFGFGLPADKVLPVGELAKPPRVVLPAATTAQDALEQMRTAHVPGAPVVNDGGEFLGAVQVRDLADVEPTRMSAPVGRIANGQAMTLPWDAGLDAALDALPGTSGGWLTVLDDHSKVTGIISAAEIVRGWQQTMQRSVREIAAVGHEGKVVDVQVAQHSAAVGRRLRELGLPTQVVVLSIMRGRGFVIPAADERIEAGDRLSVLAMDGAKHVVETAFGERRADSTTG